MAAQRLEIMSHLNAYPAQRDKMSNYIYIFGYGSLISPRGINGRGLSKKYTRDDLAVVHLNGFKREWNALYNDMRFLGLRKEPGSIINGVVFKLDIIDLDTFLKSECSSDPISLCDRLNLNSSQSLYQLTDVTNNIIWSDKILLDNPEDRTLTLVTTNPTTNGKIPQYYIDLIYYDIVNS